MTDASDYKLGLLIHLEILLFYLLHYFGARRSSSVDAPALGDQPSAGGLVWVAGAPGPTESPSQIGWCGHAGAGFVGTAPVRWPTPLPLLI